MPRFQGTPVSDGPAPRFKGELVEETTKPEAWNPVAGLSRDLVNGIPVLGPIYTGAVDAVTTQIMGLLTGEDPEAIKSRVYAKQDAYEAENPLLSTAGNIAGGTLAMAPLGMTAAGARAFGMAADMPFWQRLLFGGISGGGLSGADSLVRGDDPATAGLKALGGGLIGASAGAVAPHIAQVAGRAGEAIARLVGRPPTPNMSRPAFDTIARALSADDVLSNTGAANIARGGTGAMLADAGPSARSLLDTAIQRSGPGARIATEAVEGRAAQASDDIASALDRSLGTPQGVATTERGLRNGTAAARANAYDAAYSSPIDYASEAGRNIEGLVGRVPPSVIDTANRMMAMEGQQSRQIMAQIADNGAVTFVEMPDVRQLDYITRALNQAARSGEGQGALGGQTDIGRIYGNLARDIRDNLRSAAPQYGEALETAAQPIRQRQALQLGNEMLSPNVPRDVVRDELVGMTGPELAAVRQGIRSHIDEVLANVRAVASDPNIDAREASRALRDLSSRAAREKIGLAINDDAVSTRLFEQIDQASRALELRAGVATNSRTFGRQAMDEIIDSHFDQGVVNQLLRAEPVNAVRSVVQNVTGRTPQGVTRMKDDVYREIVQALVGPRGGAAAQMLTDIANRAAIRPGTAGYLAGGVSPTSQAIMEMLMGGN